MIDYITGNLKAKTKEGAEEIFMLLSLFCDIYHPELEPSEPKFKGKYYHVYLQKKREKDGVWMAESALNLGGVRHPLPPLSENSQKKLVELLTGRYNG